MDVTAGQCSVQIPFDNTNMESDTITIPISADEGHSYSGTAEKDDQQIAPQSSSDKEPSPIIIPATSLCKMQYQCRMCQAIFSKKWNCVSHMRAHRRVRPIFRCSTCGKHCSKQSELDIHYRIHTGEKPHFCSVCQRRFVRKSQLKSHMRSHTGDKPHLCNSCGAAFSNGSNLKRHQHLHSKRHSEKPLSKLDKARNKLIADIEMAEKLCLPIPTLDSLKLAESGHELISVLQVKSESSQTAPSGKHTSSSAATNSDHLSVDANPEKLSEDHTDEYRVDHADQLVPLSVQSVPAVASSQPVIYVHSGAPPAYREKHEVAGVFPVKEETTDSSTMVTGAVLLDSQGYSHESDTSTSWLVEVASPQGQLTLPDGGVLESSGEASSGVMQVDLSFLLEEAGLQLQPQPQTTEQPEPSPQEPSLLLDAGSTQGVFQLNNTEQLMDPSAFQIVDSVMLENPPSVVQLSVPASVLSSSPLQPSNTTPEGGMSTLQVDGAGNPIISLPAVTFSSIQQEGEEQMELTEVHNYAQTGVTEGGPVVLLVKSNLYKDHAYPQPSVNQVCIDSQVFMEQSPQIPPPAVSDSEKTQHVPVKAKVTTKAFTCDVCSQSFSRQWYLTVHRNAHFRQSIFPCDVCSAKFSRVGNLNRHKQMHTGSKPFECSECHVKFASKYRLTEHERRHKGLKPFSCNQCGCLFTDCSSLRRHQIAHRGDNLRNTCEVCGVQFRTSHGLTLHQKTHVPDRGPEFADKGVTRIKSEALPSDLPIIPLDSWKKGETAALEQACVLKSTNAAGRQQFLCCYCQKVFKFSAACRQHLLIHTGSRPYRCDDCGAKFSRKADARRHTLTHQRHKRHQCRHCHKKFQTRSRLDLHSEDHVQASLRKIPCGRCPEMFSKDRLVKIHRQIFHRHKVALCGLGTNLPNKQAEGDRDKGNNNDSGKGTVEKAKRKQRQKAYGGGAKPDSLIEKNSRVVRSKRKIHQLEDDICIASTEPQITHHIKTETVDTNKEAGVQNQLQMVDNGNGLLQTHGRTEAVQLHPQIIQSVPVQSSHHTARQPVTSMQPPSTSATSRPQRVAAKNQRDFLASLQLKRHFKSKVS